ncbi:hypothetical protein CQ054_21305 [Ochrobactrum sp. MYb29]|nr:hypothetical protein CQ054_21305 [Ochrobactrum sp. MYb29]
MAIPNLISTFPSKERAALARQNFYFKVISSLAYLVSVASPKRPMPALLHLVKVPLGAVALAPRLFFLHDSLLLAMRQQDRLKVANLVVSINEFAETVQDQKKLSVIEIKSVGKTDWEEFIIANSQTLGEEYFRIPPVISAISDVVLAEQKEALKNSIKLIEDHFSDMYLEMSGLLSNIRLFQGSVMMGITDVRMFGCLFIRVPRPEVDAQLYYAEHLTHEVSHMYLNAAMSIDPILLNDRSELFSSPLRPDPRPMIGVFHATFVTARIVQLFIALTSDRSTSEEAKVYLYQQLDELKAGIDEVARHAKLTSVGSELLQEFTIIAEKAEGLSFWNRFDRAHNSLHRFGGGRQFKPAGNYAETFASLS